MDQAGIASATEPLRIYHAWVTVRAEVESSAVNDQSFFELRQKNKPADGWLRCRNEKPVIPATVATIDCPRSEAADSVGFQPFATKSRIEICTHLFPKSDHDALSTA